jgi:RNA polymerase-binding transcription factor DksA
MDSELTREDIDYFARKLAARGLELRRQIVAALRRSDSEHYIDIAGQVHDREDEALADLLVDVQLADVTRDVQEFREVADALKRISNGTYGYCVRCGQPIPRARLEANPTAKRDAACQEIHEHEHAGQRTPSL